MRLSAVVAAVFGATAAYGAASANDVLRVLYNEHPPFMSRLGDDVVGLAADPAEAALKAAGVAFVWEESPAGRQLELIRRDAESVCALARFRTPERAAYAVYSRPLYVEKSRVILGRADDAVLASVNSLDELLADPRLTLMLKRSYSLGEIIDAKVERLAVRKWDTWVEADVMFRQIAAGRADYMFIAPEEGAYVMDEIAAETRDRLALYVIAGMPPGEARMLMCSRSTPPSVIRAIDAALPETASGADRSAINR